MNLEQRDVWNLIFKKSYEKHIKNGLTEDKANRAAAKDAIKQTWKLFYLLNLKSTDLSISEEKETISKIEKIYQNLKDLK